MLLRAPSTLRPPAAAAATALLLAAIPAGAEPLRVNGSTTVNPIVDRAAAILRAERDIEIQVDTLGGSSGGLAALADGRVDVAMSSRPITGEDRARFPAVDFRPVAIGFDAVALVVSRDVWESGVRSLSAEQMRGVYERRITNWRRLGGPDRRIAFFNKEPGRGTWEVFARWLYGSARDAPLVSFPEVGANEEARQKVASTRGGLSLLSAAWADGERIFALAIAGPAGAVSPSSRHLADGSYPMGRPLLMVTDGPASGKEEELVSFLVGPRGQELVARFGYLPLADGVARR